MTIMGTPLYFPLFSQKGNNFGGCLKTKLFFKGDLLLMERICSWGSNSLFVAPALARCDIGIRLPSIHPYVHPFTVYVK